MIIQAPFTEEQCVYMNKFQQSGRFHPFTCGGKDCRADLIATTQGWKCPKCDYTQNWAHSFMAEELKYE